ncbi:hypothetical protein NL676_018934 [Syzygium grande]|nr:hypothetical protein NL676_018934 [Syzygium grande]
MNAMSAQKGIAAMLEFLPLNYFLELGLELVTLAIATFYDQSRGHRSVWPAGISRYSRLPVFYDRRPCSHIYDIPAALLILVTPRLSIEGSSSLQPPTSVSFDWDDFSVKYLTPRPRASTELRLQVSQQQPALAVQYLHIIINSGRCQLISGEHLAVAESFLCRPASNRGRLAPRIHQSSRRSSVAIKQAFTAVTDWFTKLAALNLFFAGSASVQQTTLEPPAVF